MKRRSVSILLATAALATAGAAAPAAAALRCDVTIGASGSGNLGGLELRVGYSASGGEFGGSGEAVSCTALAAASYQSARDDDDAEELDLGFLSVAGVELPADLWRCSFETSGGAPTPGAFTFHTDDAVAPDLQPLEVSGAIRSIACDAASVCGNGIVEGSEQCDTGGAGSSCDAGCKLTRNSQRCSVGIHVEGSGALGGIQFGLDYGDANGQFEGSGLAVACSRVLESALTAATDVDAQNDLRLALVSTGGIAVPAELWRCIFLTAATPLALDRFHVHGLLATDPDVQPLDVDLHLEEEGCTFGPYCGDGHLDPEETCDDGNSVTTDACTNACLPAVCGDGITRTGVEQCDEGGGSGRCCTGSCSFASSSTVCRSAAGVCDLAESCSGSSASCPNDVKSNSPCRPSAGVCDIAETCTGSSNDCPADAKSTAVCRPSSGVCDVTETCNGTGAACPADAFAPASTACSSDGNGCTDDHCSGSGSCAHVPNSLPCNDGLFCNGSDTCSGGSCAMHGGDPCPGSDNDSNCSETCSETLDSCTANDPDGASCNDNDDTTSGDQCQSGTCIGSSGVVLCGDADGNGKLQASDALRVLRKSVGQVVSCPRSACDTDNNGAVQSSDALRVLKKAVGQQATLNCPLF